MREVENFSSSYEKEEDQIEVLYWIDAS